jgi:hypothetical protein
MITTDDVNHIAKLLALTPTQKERFHELMAPHLPKISANADRTVLAAADLATLKGSLSAADSLRIDPERGPAIDRVKRIMRRVGYPLGDFEKVDSFRLDKLLASSSESIENRIALKLEMAALGLLPRVC